MRRKRYTNLPNVKWKIRVDGDEYNVWAKQFLSSATNRLYYIGSETIRIYDTVSCEMICEFPILIDCDTINCVALLPKLHKLLFIIEGKYACIIDDDGLLVAKRDLPVSGDWGPCIYGSDKVVLAERFGFSSSVSPSHPRRVIVINCSDDDFSFETVQPYYGIVGYAVLCNRLLQDRYMLHIFENYSGVMLLDVVSGESYKSPIVWRDFYDHEAWVDNDGFYFGYKTGMVKLKVCHDSGTNVLIDRFCVLPIFDHEKIKTIVGVYDNKAILVCENDRLNTCVVAADLSIPKTLYISEAKVEDIVRDIDDYGNSCIVTRHYSRKLGDHYFVVNYVDWRNCVDDLLRQVHVQ
jgi:hypothetical protein